jgi:glycosyltransferase involved in cell wall biosynthesis
MPSLVNDVVEAAGVADGAGEPADFAPADIVIVSDVAHVNGGDSQVALSSAVALAGRGYRVMLFAASAPVMPELLTTKNVRLVLTGQHEIVNDPKRLRAATQGIWNVQAARMFAQALAPLDPARTIVHVHSWTKALSSSVLKVAVNRGFSVVLSLHDYFVACPIGSLYNHPRGEICRLRPMSARCVRENCDPRSYRDKAWRVARQLVQRSLGRIPDGIHDFITLSDLSESVLAPALPAAAHLHRVSNPIEVGLRSAADVARNAAYVYVGRLSREKGAALFARAAKQAGVSGVFLGDGECADEVRQANPDAEISGWLPRSALLERLSQARALVFPSLWYENSPLAVAEAAALGVPAIVADTCAGRERVSDGVNGKLFRGGDVDALAQALTELENDDVAARLGANAYHEYWKAPLHMENHLSQLIPVYEKMMRRSLRKDAAVRL